MKIIQLIIIAACLTGCATVTRFADTANLSIVAVQNEHTPEEWRAFYAVLATVAEKGSALAFTKAGTEIFSSIAEVATSRAESWQARIPLAE